MIHFLLRSGKFCKLVQMYSSKEVRMLEWNGIKSSLSRPGKDKMSFSQVIVSVFVVFAFLFALVVGGINFAISKIIEKDPAEAVYTMSSETKTVVLTIGPDLVDQCKDVPKDDLPGCIQKVVDKKRKSD